MENKAAYFLLYRGVCLDSVTMCIIFSIISVSTALFPPHVSVSFQAMLITH